MKKLLSLLMAVLMMLSLCACGSGKPASPSAAAGDYAMSAPAAVYEAAAEEAWYDYDDGYYAAEAPAAANGGLASGETAAAAESKSEAGDINTEKIIYSANVTVETTDFENTLRNLEAMVASYGGFIESSSVSGNTYYNTSSGKAGTRYASYTIRVPGKDFQTVMATLASLGNVPYSYTYTENVTAQYYDTQSRLEAYKAQQDSLIAMMEKAETVEDLITIENALVEVRYKIDSLQSSLTNWDRKVNYSTISLEINEVKEYTPEAKEGYGQKLVRAMKSGLKSVGDFFADLLLGLLEALPSLIVLAVFVILVVIIVKKARKKRTAKKAAKAEPNPEEKDK